MASKTNYKWISAPGSMCRLHRTLHSSNQEDETLVLGPISPRSATKLARGAAMAPTFQRTPKHAVHTRSSGRHRPSPGYRIHA
eukprot:12934647-Prorocentrum_lima.AAC.1